MDYKLFNAEEFAADESFISYYLKKDEQDVAYWENWISCHPEKLDEVLNAESLLAIVHLRLDTAEQEDAFNRFDAFVDEHAFTHDQQSFNPANTNRIYRRSFNFRMAAIAASIIFMLSMGGLYFYNQPATAVKTEYVTIRNGYGTLKIISLADGTQVSLNANSSLTYPKIFDQNKREVSLNGEAFFEVAKDKSRPFTVSANGTKTRVLGTRFNVNAYSTQKTEVALVEGSVAFNPGGTTPGSSEEIMLRPSDMLTYTKNNNKVKLTNFKGAAVTAWTTGIILFSNASFADVATRFQQLYGIQLKDNSHSGQWNYSGQFTKSDYLTIIKSICFAKNFTYTQKNNTITLNNN